MKPLLAAVAIVVILSGCSASASGDSAAAAKPAPVPKSKSDSGGSASKTPHKHKAACDKNYLPCVRKSKRDLECSDLKTSVHVVGRDVYNFDLDGDGIGCELNPDPDPADLMDEQDRYNLEHQYDDYLPEPPTNPGDDYRDNSEDLYPPDGGSKY